MNRSALLRRISALSFTSWELHLYLDTHPQDGEAIAKAEEIDRKLAKFKEEFEKEFGPLSIKDVNGNGDKWLKDPWPWDYDFGGTE